MSAVASQITSVCIVCSTVGSGADQRKHQSSVSLAFVRLSQVKSNTFYCHTLMVNHTSHNDHNNKRSIWQQGMKEALLIGPSYWSLIHTWPVNSPHKWPVTRKMFLFDDVIMLLLLTTGIFMGSDRTKRLMAQIHHLNQRCITFNRAPGNTFISKKRSSKYGISKKILWSTQIAWAVFWVPGKHDWSIPVRFPGTLVRTEVVINMVKAR